MDVRTIMVFTLILALPACAGGKKKQENFFKKTVPPVSAKIEIKEDLTKKDVMKAYLSGINRADGVDRFEAVTLAQAQIFFKDKDSELDFAKPYVAFDSPEAWGIGFPSLTNEGETQVLAVNKSSGDVVWQE